MYGEFEWGRSFHQIGLEFIRDSKDVRLHCAMYFYYTIELETYGKECQIDDEWFYIYMRSLTQHQQ